MINTKKNGHKSNHKINFIVEGEGEPIVLIHGLGASLYNWDYLIPELAASGYKSIALDLPGHGDSHKSDDPDHYHMDKVFSAFEKWVEALEIEQPFYLLGHSMGAYFCLKLALLHPSKIKGLVLVDPYYSPDHLSSLIRMVSRRTGISKKVLNATPEWLIYPLVKNNKNIAVNLSNDMVKQMTSDFKRIDPNCLHITSTTSDLTPYLSDVEQDVLILWGENDRTISPRSFQYLVQHIPRSRGKQVAGAGHTPHLSKPKEFNQHVIQFLNSIPNIKPV